MTEGIDKNLVQAGDKVKVKIGALVSPNWIKVKEDLDFGLVIDGWCIQNENLIITHHEPGPRYKQAKIKVDKDAYCMKDGLQVLSSLSLPGKVALGFTDMEASGDYTWFTPSEAIVFAKTMMGIALALDPEQEV